MIPEQLARLWENGRWPPPHEDTKGQAKGIGLVKWITKVPKTQ